MIRKTVILIYVSVLVILLVTTLLALLDGGYHIAGGFMAGVAAGSAIASLVPFFIAMNLFKKHETDPEKHKHLKVLGWIIYPFCFPVKIWVIYSNIDLLINGGSGWAFG